MTVKLLQSSCGGGAASVGLELEVGSVALFGSTVGSRGGLICGGFDLHLGFIGSGQATGGFTAVWLLDRV